MTKDEWNEQIGKDLTVLLTISFVIALLFVAVLLITDKF